MKYYLIECISFNDGTKDSLSIYTYDDEETAVTRFHKELGGWRQKTNVSHVLCMVINSDGLVFAQDTWTGSALPPVPEPVEE